MKQPKWLEREALLLLHGQSLARFGGADGITSEGLLDSALARPINRYNFAEGADLADLAASYAFGLVKNHPFVDGNKRIAFLVCGVFLDINGKTLKASASEAVSAVLALAGGDIGEPEFAVWLRAHLD